MILNKYKKKRKEGDSNPRSPYELNGFQDRRFQPLTHLSVIGNNLILFGVQDFFF